jgi:hypothetical protein
MSITIIFGKPRIGKTALMTFLGSQFVFDRNRYKSMYNEIDLLNAGNFNNGNLSKPSNVLFSNYGIIAHKYGYSPRRNNYVNPFLIGYANPFVETVYLPAYSVVCITEGQKYFNSRMTLKYPDWQSRFYEQHGHNDYDFFIDVQRPGLIDVNIRDLASFIEVVKKQDIIKHGKIFGIQWLIRFIEGSSELERYLSSGKKDVTTYTEQIITCDFNVHRLYDSKMCKPKFYDGHFSDDFDINQFEPFNETAEDYQKYLEKFNDELPDNFYKRSA